MSEFDIKCCLGKVRRILEAEPTLLELSAPLKVVGDMYDLSIPPVLFFLAMVNIVIC